MSKKGTPLPPVDPASPPDGMRTLLDVLMFRCSAPPYVWIGAIGWASIFAIWSIFSPNWKDVAKFDKQGSWLHQGKWVLEDVEFQRPTWVMQGETVMFEIAEVTDFVAFWMMVGEAIAEGLIEAASMIWKFSPCERHVNVSYYYSKTLNGLVPTTDPPQWGPYASWTHGQSSSGDPNLGSEVVVPPNSSLSIGWHVSYANIVGGSPRPCNTRLIDVNTGEVWKEVHWKPEYNDGKASNLGYVKQITTGDTAKVLQLQVQMQQVYPDVASWPNEGHIAVEITTITT